MQRTYAFFPQDAQQLLRVAGGRIIDHPVLSLFGEEGSGLWTAQFPEATKGDECYLWTPKRTSYHRYTLPNGEIQVEPQDAGASHRCLFVLTAQMQDAYFMSRKEVLQGYPRIAVKDGVKEILVPGLLRAQGESVFVDGFGTSRPGGIIMQEPTDTLVTAQLLEDQGAIAWKRADYADAQHFYEHALAIRERVQGNHPETARTLNNLGMLCQSQGALDEARAFYQRAFSLSEQIQGRAHPESIGYLGDIAGILNELGHAELAQERYEEAIALSEQVQGADHPDTALALSKLARFLRTQQQYEQAEGLFQRAVRIYEKTPTIDSSALAPVLNNFGVLYLDWGRLESAEPLLIQALTLWRRMFDPDHHNTAIALKNLGRLSLLQGDEQEALTKSEQALNIIRENLEERILRQWPWSRPANRYAHEYRRNNDFFSADIRREERMNDPRTTMQHDPSRVQSRDDISAHWTANRGAHPIIAINKISVLQGLRGG